MEKVGTCSGRLAMAAFCLALIVASCATTEMATVKPVSSGFLGNDYALLTPGETAKGQAGLRYFDPAAQWRRYNKVMIEPVTFWGGALRPAAVDPTAGFSAGSHFTKKLIGSTPPIPIGYNYPL